MPLIKTYNIIFISRDYCTLSMFHVASFNLKNYFGTPGNGCVQKLCGCLWWSSFQIFFINIEVKALNWPIFQKTRFCCITQILKNLTKLGIKCFLSNWTFMILFMRPSVLASFGCTVFFVSPKYQTLISKIHCFCVL